MFRQPMSELLPTRRLPINGGGFARPVCVVWLEFRPVVALNVPA